jgi:hypothetical protein
MKPIILKKLIEKPNIALGLFIFVFTIIGALYFYRERVIYIDSAYYVFNLINNGIPNAEHNRYALFLYQIIPWALLKLNFSIPLILKAFSFSHILIHAIAFSILVKIKQNKIAILLALMQIICYRECFYLSVNETSLAITASLLLSGLLRYSEARKNIFLSGLLFFACIFIAILSHPMALLIIPFVLFYFTISSSVINKSIIATCFSSFLIVIVIKYFISSSSSYETELYDQIKKSSDIILNLPNIYSFKYFAGGLNFNSNFIQLYFIPLLGFIVSIIYYFSIKRYLLASFLIAGNIGLWLIIIILFNRGDGNMFMEKNFAPWILISLYPFIDIQIQKNKSKMLLHFLIVVYSINSILGIYEASKPYTKRYEIIENILVSESKTNRHKLIIQDSLVNHDIWLGTWALPYETLLMSKVLEIPNSSIRIYKNEESINKEINRTDLFLGADFIPPLPASYLLNQKYFKLFEEKYIAIKPHP